MTVTENQEVILGVDEYMRVPRDINSSRGVTADHEISRPVSSISPSSRHTASTSGHDNDDDEDVFRECETPRIPMAWAHRETRVPELAVVPAAKVVRSHGYRPLYSKTIGHAHPQPKANLHCTALEDSLAVQPRCAQKTVFSKIAISGFQTLLAGCVYRSENRNIVNTQPGRTTEQCPVSTFYHQHRYEAGIFSLDHIAAPPRNGINGDETGKPQLENNPYTVAHPDSHNGTPLPKSPNATEVVSVHQYSASTNIHLVPVQLPTFVVLNASQTPIPPNSITLSRSGSSTSSKDRHYDPCSNANCCKGGLLVMWIIISVILLGIIVGITVLLTRRNNTI